MSHLEVGRNRLHQIKWADTYDYKLQDMHVELVKDFLPGSLNGPMLWNATLTGRSWMWQTR